MLVRKGACFDRKIAGGQRPAEDSGSWLFSAGRCPSAFICLSKRIFFLSKRIVETPAFLLCYAERMPCYLFTYHAFGSWMPDRPRGYVIRYQGIVPPSNERAKGYRERATQDNVHFDDSMQKLLIEESLKASQYQDFCLHYIATDPTHLHVLASWKDARPWLKIRGGIKSSLSRRLNNELGKQHWFVDSSSRKQVKDQQHYDYLINVYLPKHSGWKWSERRESYR